MKRVVSAIESGRFAMAVSGALLRDADVMLELTKRGALLPMALSGQAVAPVQALNDLGLSRAVSEPNGVLVLVEPETQDMSGLQRLGKLLSRAPHKPKVLVVARQYNPLAVGSALGGARTEHLKSRGKLFVRDLPMPPADLEAPKANVVQKARAKDSSNAPRMHFVGREEELATLTEMLGADGPIVVSGAHGIGKRWLVDQAIAQLELTRAPDVVIGRGTGFDSVVARLASLTAAAGASQLADALKNDKRTPVSIVDAAIEALKAATDLAKQVLLVENLHLVMGRERDFFRKSRLELLIEALLSNSYALRIVFTAPDQPILHREGQGSALRRLELGGVKGRFLFDIFQAYKAPEFPRDRFGPMADRTHGHPMVARTYAIEVRERPDGLELTEDTKFFSMEAASDLEPLRKKLKKRLGKLDKSTRGALARLAHLRSPVGGQVVSQLGLSRKVRLALLSQGLLDMVGTESDKAYRVHNLVRLQMSLRETSDFGTYGEMVDLFAKLASQANSDAQKLAYQQELNRCAYAGRHMRRRVRLPYPDSDPILESCIGMIRGSRPNFSLAEQRIAEAIKLDPSNADAHLLRLELYRAMSSDKLMAAAEEAMTLAPVPEIFHRAVGLHLDRKARHKAIAVLERAVEALPNEARLRCRLGALLMRQGRRNEAMDHFRAAMDLAPMLPDAYGLLGTAKRDEGLAGMKEAEELLREAVRLAPTDPVQVSRLASFLVDKARGEGDSNARRDMHLEARDLLEGVLREEHKAPEAYLTLARLVRETSLDWDRVNWLLTRSKKATERGHERHHRISIERALVKLHGRGDLDGAEKLLRDQAGRNPGSHSVFAALAKVLEARLQLIPAHAELLRALERAPKGSLVAAEYERALERLQGLVEAQAKGLLDMSQVQVPTVQPGYSAKPKALKRRKKADGSDSDGSDASAEAPETAEAAPETAEAVEAAPEAVEAAPEAIEAAPEAVEVTPEAAEPVEPAPVAVDATAEGAQAEQ